MQWSQWDRRMHAKTQEISFLSTRAVHFVLHGDIRALPGQSFHSVSQQASNGM